MTVKSFFLIQLIIIIDSIIVDGESWQVMARLRCCCWGASDRPSEAAD